MAEFTKKEKNHYANLANALGITVEDLALLDFYNEEIFDDSGIAVQNKFCFSENSPQNLLSKIKRLDENNCIVLDAKVVV